jgi:hypothetical protein
MLALPQGHCRLCALGCVYCQMDAQAAVTSLRRV